jgi:PAS domain S-box-containing protein
LVRSVYGAKVSGVQSLIDEKASFPAIKGEMAALVRAYDWAATPLGPIGTWPQSLKSAVSTILLSPVPIVMLWGPDGIMIYNDGYSVFAGARHPQLLGSKVLEGWAEVADFNANVMRVGLAGGTLAYRDQELTLHRHGRPEQVWMDLDYSPVLDESGKPAGVIAIVIETTDRVLAERARAEETERQRRVFEQAPSFMAQLEGPEHVFSFTNDAYRRLIGGRNVVGKTIREALPDLEGQGFYELLDRVYASGEPFVGRGSPVTLQQRPDGPLEDRVLDFIYQPVRDASGAVTGIFVDGYDVTEQHEAEDALRRSEEHLRLATDSAELGLWDMDLVNNIARQNARVKAMFGMPPDADVAPEDFFAVIHPDDIELMQDAYQSAQNPAKRTGYNVQYRAIGRDDGIVRWIEARGRGMFDADGNCIRIMGTATDITERKQAELREQILARLGEKLRTIEDPDELSYAAAEILGRAFNVSRAGYGTIDPRDETITIARDWNAPGIQSLAGTLHFRDYGSYIDDLKAGRTAVIGDARLDPRTKATASALEAISARSFVNMPVTEQGGFVALLYLNHATPREWTLDDLDVIREVAERTRIAVERRRAEEAVREAERRFREELEAQVLERTEALRRTEQALQQAQKMEAIGNLTGGIAHDFNNLLQGVTGSLDLIRRRPEATEKVQRWAAAGLQAAERGAKLTAQLLAFSRSQKLELKPLDVSALLLGMRDLLARTLGPAFDISIDAGDAALGVMGDETQLELAVLNLAINARDAMGDRGALAIAAHPYTSSGDSDLPDGDYVELTVSDTGSGMPADVVARAFDPFFTTKGVGKGTGLGLSQVYGMARQAGGVARIRSAPGEGTTVSILLSRTDPEPAQASDGVDGENVNDGIHAKVLIIDDDPDVRRFLTDSLDALGYAVIEAHDGASGLTTLVNSVPDVMIVDYAMPGMTGAEVASKARSMRPNMPIVFASGYAETTALENVLDGNTQILRKPFRVGELQDALNKALAR